MKPNRFFVGQLIIVLFVVSIMLLINDFLNIGLFIVALSSLLTLFWSKWMVGNYTNATVIFLAFSILYGLSGPINAVWGEGLHRIFSYPYAVVPFLISYSLSNIGIMMGITFFYLVKKDNIATNSNAITNLDQIFEKREKIINLAIILAIISSAFEMLNLIRAGGIGLLFTGKATFQSQISGLTLTLPSTELIIIGFSLVSIYIAASKAKNYKSNRTKTKIIFFLLSSVPFVLMKMVLGQRGILLAFMICLIIGITYFKPIKKIKLKLILWVLIAYVFFAFIFANRGIVSLIQHDPSQFISTAFQRERVVNALNPGANEFGAAFGNYSEFYKKHGMEFYPRMGSTYLKGLVLPIPSFIYPGEKPKQITYEFRDDIFPSEASRGRIAGTGFSSILEAYMNFKYLGVIFIYFLIGYFLQKIDDYYKYKNLYFIILYISSISQTVSFHRSAFGTIYSNIFIRVILLVPVIFYINCKTRKSRNSSIK